MVKLYKCLNTGNPISIPEKVVCYKNERKVPEDLFWNDSFYRKCGIELKNVNSSFTVFDCE